MMERLLITPKEAADMLDISVRTLRKRTQEGDIPTVQIGKRQKYCIEDIRAIAGSESISFDVTPEEERDSFAGEWWYVLSRTKSNARLRGIKFSLSKEDMNFLVGRANGRCEVSGIRFNRERVSERYPYAPSIDRIDSSNGYSKDNCRIVCFAVNLALNNWGDDVLKEIAYGVVVKDRGL